MHGRTRTVAGCRIEGAPHDVRRAQMGDTAAHHGRARPVHCHSRSLRTASGTVPQGGFGAGGVSDWSGSIRCGWAVRWLWRGPLFGAGSCGSAPGACGAAGCAVAPGAVPGSCPGLRSSPRFARVAGALTSRTRPLHVPVPEPEPSLPPDPYPHPRSAPLVTGNGRGIADGREGDGGAGGGCPDVKASATRAKRGEKAVRTPPSGEPGPRTHPPDQRSRTTKTRTGQGPAPSTARRPATSHPHNTMPAQPTELYATTPRSNPSTALRAFFETVLPSLGAAAAI